MFHRQSEMLMTDRPLSSSISNFSESELRTIRRYLKNVYHRVDNMIENQIEHYPQLSEESIEILEDEAEFAKNYVDCLFNKAEN